MGITGLIPFLEKASIQCNVRDLRNSTVAVDTYCWLHKGAFACADKLARGEKTDIHIQYCLKYVNMLLAHNIKPILVFDGRHLPAKANTEAKRREQRKQAKIRATELLRLGKHDEARTFLRRCVDITHEMALQLIQECRRRNIDCIVAPYEADAQLAYLNRIRIADYVITEDSDLVLFGCDKILFKLDLTGQCLFVDREKLHLSMKCHPDKFTFDKFRNMCIMSGCDYIDSLPGIGLSKACKFFRKTEETDLWRALSKIPAYLNMRHLEITDEYKKAFLMAEATFQHMIVYDPLDRKLTRLTDPKETGTDLEMCSNAGEFLDNEIAFQLALGNLNPFTLKSLDDWHPDRCNIIGGKTRSWKESVISKHKSIWKDYSRKTINDPIPIHSIKSPHKSPIKSPKKQILVRKSLLTEENVEELNDCNLFERYGIDRSVKKFKPNPSVQSESDSSVPNSHNPFAIKEIQKLEPIIQLKSPTHSSFLQNVSPVKKVEPKFRSDLPKFRQSTKSNGIDTKQRVISRFFVTQPKVEQSNDPIIDPEIVESDNQELTVSEIKRIHELNDEETSSIYSLTSSECLEDVSTQLNSDPILLIPEDCPPTEVTYTIDDESNDSIILPKIHLQPSSSKTKPKGRRIGLKSTKKFDKSQSKLSMFGFQKRPHLKG